MGRRLRFLPPEGLVEVTSRTIQGRLLLRPTERIAELCRGALARAARLHPVRVHAFVFLGNHYHLLLSAPSPQRLSAFMGQLNSNLAREIGRSVGWRERFWGRRYQAIPVSREEPAQLERLLYILRHGCKENLVRRPLDWPGASSTRGLLTGRPIRATWLDRSAYYEANRRRRSTDPDSFRSSESLTLAPLPCWAHLGSATYRQRIRELVDGVERESERRIRETGRLPLGRERIVRQDPHSVPQQPKRGHAPFVHAATSAVRRAFRNQYRAFLSAFRKAVDYLRKAGPSAEAFARFPPGSFPPSIGFIPVRGTIPV